MLNNQDFMGRSVGSFAVKDQGMSERVRSDEDRVVRGHKWSNCYFDHDQTNNYVQLVPEIHREEEEKYKEDVLAVVVPDEHSQTDDHHHIKDFSDGSDNRIYLRYKHEKPKKRRIKISSDEELDEFTREVPSVTRKGSNRRRRRRRYEMCDKMRALQHLVPNCHKTDKVLVLDNTIEYMKNLQLQLKVMSIMGMNNPYCAPAASDFGMQNQMLTAMALAHGQNPVNQTTSPPLISALNWPLPPFTNLSFSHSSTALPASSPQCLCSFVPYFPIPMDFSSNAMGRL